MALFAENFWGEKCNGLEVLLTNMKLGNKAPNEFVDFLREFSAVEESYVKWLSKILRQISVNASFSGCSFSPIWSIYKQFLDKLVAMHSQLSGRYSETARLVTLYSEEQQRRTKQIRDNEAVAQESVSNLLLHAGTITKTREVYLLRSSDLERARRDGVTQRDLDRIESKWRKANDDYRAAVDRYNATRTEYEWRHIEVARKLNEIDEQHLSSMCEFSSNFLESLLYADTTYHNHVAELQTQLSELGSAKHLLASFVRSNATGREKPAMILFDPAGEPNTGRNDTLMVQSQAKDKTAKIQRDQNASPSNVDQSNVLTYDSVGAIGYRRSVPDSAVLAMSRSNTTALQQVRGDDFHANGEKAVKRESSSNVGSFANVAAAMSRGLIKRTNWVSASIRLKGKHTTGNANNRNESSVTGVGDLISTSATNTTAPQLSEPATSVCIPTGQKLAINELMSIDFTSTTGPDDVLLNDTNKGTALAHDTDSEESSSDEDKAGSAFRTLHVRIRPLEAAQTASSTVDTTTHNDALRASVAELKLTSDIAALRKKADSRRTSNPNTTLLNSTESYSEKQKTRQSIEAVADSSFTEFVADFSQFHQRVADQERGTRTTSPNWVGFGIEHGSGSVNEDHGNSATQVQALQHGADDALQGLQQPVQDSKSSSISCPAVSENGNSRTQSPKFNASSFLSFTDPENHFQMIDASPNESPHLEWIKSKVIDSAVPFDSRSTLHLPPLQSISGKLTPTSLEVAFSLATFPSPAPESPPDTKTNQLANSVFPVDAFGLSSSPISGQSSQFSPKSERPPPPARSQSALGVTISSKTSASRGATPTVPEAEEPALLETPIAASYPTKFQFGSFQRTASPSSLVTGNSFSGAANSLGFPRSLGSGVGRSTSRGDELTSKDPFLPDDLKFAECDLPFNVLISEKVHAKLVTSRPEDPVTSRRQPIVKLTGVMSLSFSSAVVHHLCNLTDYSKLRLQLRLIGTAAIDHIQVNKVLVTPLTVINQSEYEVNISALISNLRQLSRRTVASDYSVDCVKFQCQSSADGSVSRLRPPLDLATYWRHYPNETNYKVEYAMLPDALYGGFGNSSLIPQLRNISFRTTISGGVQSMRPTGTVDLENQSVLWKVADVCDTTRHVLGATLQLSNGPSLSAPTVAEFTCDNHTLTEFDIETIGGTSFRLVDIRRSLMAGTYECEPMTGAQPFEAITR